MAAKDVRGWVPWGRINRFAGGGGMRNGGKGLTLMLLCDHFTCRAVLTPGAAPLPLPPSLPPSLPLKRMATMHRKRWKRFVLFALAYLVAGAACGDTCIRADLDVRKENAAACAACEASCSSNSAYNSGQVGGCEYGCAYFYGFSPSVTKCQKYCSETSSWRMEVSIQ